MSHQNGNRLAGPPANRVQCFPYPSMRTSFKRVRTFCHASSPRFDFADGLRWLVFPRRVAQFADGRRRQSALELLMNGARRLPSEQWTLSRPFMWAGLGRRGRAQPGSLLPGQSALLRDVVAALRLRPTSVLIPAALPNSQTRSSSRPRTAACATASSGCCRRTEGRNGHSPTR